jgi:hypothetical protein
MPVRAIQELAGHRDISTTMRYIHLSPSTLDDTIWTLERRDANFAAYYRPVNTGRTSIAPQQAPPRRAGRTPGRLHGCSTGGDRA